MSSAEPASSAPSAPPPSPLARILIALWLGVVLVGTITYIVLMIKR